MKRITFLDSLKGLAIIFVLWGHSIQYLRDGDDFLNNPIFEFIYSFHMPLFFIISGFFFKSSLKKSFNDFTINKFKQLLLPSIVWTLIFVGLSQFALEFNINWKIILSRIFNPQEWFYWFLRELFISYFLMYFFYKIFKNLLMAIVFSMTLMLIMPFGFTLQRTFFPFFVFGILLKENYEFLKKYKSKLIIIFGILFLICLIFWKGVYTVYRTDFPPIINWQLWSLNLSNIKISVFRFFIGLVGGLFFLLLTEKFDNQNLIFKNFNKIGKQTLGIYILQLPLLERLANRYLDFSSVNIWVFNLLITPLVSFITLIVCLFIIHLINKNKYLGLFLLGNATMVNNKKNN